MFSISLSLHILDDINDLLKFYKKVPMPEDAAIPATVSLQSSDAMSLAVDSHTTSTATTVESGTLDASMAVNLAGNAVTTGATSATNNRDASISDADIRASGVGATNANAVGSTATIGNNAPSTTPANIGYIRSWRNPLNFTIMLTLRVRVSISTYA